MRANFFCTNFLNTPNGLGHPSQIPGTSHFPSLETQGNKLSSEGTNFSTPTQRTFRPPPLRMEDPHPTRQLPGLKGYSLCSLFLPDLEQGERYSGDWLASVWKPQGEEGSEHRTERSPLAMPLRAALHKRLMFRHLKRSEGAALFSGSAAALPCRPK